MQKSSVEEIRQNFDGMVDRFSNLETGQSTAIDSPLCMELVAQTAFAMFPQATQIMDIGCGGGNYAVKMAQLFPNADYTLVDISKNMLDQAQKRVSEVVSGKITTINLDYRTINFTAEKYDIITAGTTLHHLRTEQEWESVYHQLYSALKPNGALFVNDIVIGENSAIDKLMLEGWKSVLRKNVPTEVDFFLAKYQSEDTPQTLTYQLELMKIIGFSQVAVLHKHFNFATFVGIKTNE